MDEKEHNERKEAQKDEHMRIDELCEEIAKIIAAYREGEIPRPDKNHVKKWILQFPQETRLPILAEMVNVLNNTYFTKENVRDFISGLIHNKKLAGEDAQAFWKKVCFLKIQQKGNSQKEMLQQFDAAIKRVFNLKLGDYGKEEDLSDTFIYLDDVVFSGNRVKQDLEKWVREKAPKKCNVHIIAIVFHKSGQWYAKGVLEKAAQETKKDITFHWWRCKEIEDRRTYIDHSDVLRPREIPNKSVVHKYAEKLKEANFPPLFRKIAKPPYQSPLFSSEDGRQTLEQAFLLAGCTILEDCPTLPEQIRPLGFSLLKTLGFGSLIITYRNCPNTVPVAIWAGNPWYPLFPRKTN